MRGNRGDRNRHGRQRIGDRRVVLDDRTLVFSHTGFEKFANHVNLSGRNTPLTRLDAGLRVIRVDDDRTAARDMNAADATVGKGPETGWIQQQDAGVADVVGSTDTELRLNGDVLIGIRDRGNFDRDSARADRR